MSAIKQKETTVIIEKEIIANVLFECGFVLLSDKKAFFHQLENGEYIRVSQLSDSIRGLIMLFGGNSFDLLASAEHKKVAAKVANRLLQKYKEISE